MPEQLHGSVPFMDQNWPKVDAPAMTAGQPLRAGVCGQDRRQEAQRARRGELDTQCGLAGGRCDNRGVSWQIRRLLMLPGREPPQARIPVPSAGHRDSHVPEQHLSAGGSSPNAITRRRTPATKRPRAWPAGGNPPHGPEPRRVLRGDWIRRFWSNCEPAFIRGGRRSARSAGLIRRPLRRV